MMYCFTDMDTEAQVARDKANDKTVMDLGKQCQCPGLSLLSYIACEKANSTSLCGRKLIRPHYTLM